jgi:serine/threonine protein kinase
MDTPNGGTTGMQLGPYLLRERLGLGGMASVWKAIDERGRTLVVKRILPHLAEDPEFVDMFVREAAISARMRHANIVRVYDHGDYEGERYLAMEYLHGKDVVSVMAALAPQGLPSPGLGAFVAREVCRALVFVHALTDDRGTPLNLIHRDVSLSNVMLAYDGSVKLLDFGVAKALADERAQRTAAGVLKGKWAYLAPEQVDAGPIDHRADIFSLGIVLHEMLSGRRLFKAPSGVATLEKVRAAKVLAPSQFNPAVPEVLDAICLKALAKNPADRFQTARELAAALDQVVAELGYGGPELALQLKQLFPAEAAAYFAAQTLTPAGEWLSPAFDAPDTEVENLNATTPMPAIRAVGPLKLEELRVRTSPIRKLGRSRKARLAIAATLAIALGGLTGWQIARAQAGGGLGAMLRSARRHGSRLPDSAARGSKGTSAARRRPVVARSA